MYSTLNDNSIYLNLFSLLSNSNSGGSHSEGGQTSIGTDNRSMVDDMLGCMGGYVLLNMDLAEIKS